MTAKHSEVTWEGGMDGTGSFEVESGEVEGTFTFPTRFEGESGTNPEELIGAAHAGCFSMQFTAFLEEDGYTAERIHTTADVHLESANGGFEITTIELHTEASVPDIDEDTFMEHAEAAKEGCPVSKALAGPTITLNAELTG